MERLLRADASVGILKRHAHPTIALGHLVQLVIQVIGWRILKSEGMANWELFQDTKDIGHYIEIRIADTWTDHMRQHERVTKNVQIMEDKIRALLKDGPKPIVSHYIGKSASK